MSDIVKLMIQIWNMDTMDWLGYDNDEKYSFHHIKKQCDGGEKIISNGALIHTSSHSYIHTIEHYDLDRYIYINTILKAINEQKYMPSKEQLEQIKLALLGFQNEYEGKVSSRGKPIIKKEYIIER